MTIEQRYAEGLEAWRVNSAHQAAVIARLTAGVQRIADGYGGDVTSFARDLLKPESNPNQWAVDGDGREIIDGR